MRRKRRTIAGCLGVSVLALAAGAVLLALNRTAVVRYLDETLAAQSERADATLFRLGEVLSIRAELKSEYGSEPEVTYDRDAEGRTLRIEFKALDLPPGSPVAERAREIAAFAIGKTEKADRVDAIEVRLPTAPGEVGSFRFSPAALGPATTLPR